MSLVQPTERTSLLVDHYEIERVLGRGAMGVVYLARDVRIGRRVALKTLNERARLDSSEAGLEFFERFRREAELCGALSHPNIVALYEIGYEFRRVSFLAMEYVEGESLLALMRRAQKMPVRTAFRLAIDVLRGLSYAHQQGVIHRDVKPANILISLQGTAKLTDFGIARGEEEGGTSLTAAGQLLGTPHYMAPEHIAGQAVTTQSDLFSAGVVLYECLTGRKPFDGPDIFEVLYKVVNTAPPDIRSIAPEVPAWAAQFVERLLQKSPHQRFLSAASAEREATRLLAIAARESETEGLTDFDLIPISVRNGLSPEETPTTPIIAARIRRHPRLADRLRATVPGTIAMTVVGVTFAAALIVVFGLRMISDARPLGAEHRGASALHEARAVVLPPRPLTLPATKSSAAPTTPSPGPAAPPAGARVAVEITRFPGFPPPDSAR